VRAVAARGAGGTRAAGGTGATCTPPGPPTPGVPPVPTNTISEKSSKKGSGIFHTDTDPHRPGYRASSVASGREHNGARELCSGPVE